ncbi:hypothetical protein LKL35_01985 [Streptomyces sp. ET3-23]|uniref:hotdog fold thioesterase n=1 Tax=Streptomyces sp. ET3-23 TaxID=2885643 RepID=UPI001D110A44|nr:beta-ketoacyl synthase N-terminal-like domain-containing protein [Streptomyces sp. ET3-23]MCC2274210.1 hypothetical protein [Streptomyces sp. ET3-23]
MGFEPIAVVGRGCVLPGALTPGRFWENVAAGRSALGPAPPGRRRLPPGSDIRAGTTPDGRDGVPCDAGGYVHGFADAFDPTGFALDSADIRRLDELVPWVLHAGRQALHEAGHPGPAPHGTGLVLGNLCHPSDAAARHAEHVWARYQQPPVREALLGIAGSPPDPRNRFSSGLPALLAARALGLDAGAFALDAACASALYAVKLACDRLHDRTARLMLAGAVNRADNLLVHSGFAVVSALSATGRSRPFHRDADGIVPAEGAALVALMRLADALAEDRPVLAVIRGIGLGNDGRSTGFLSPDPAGQERAMRLAYAAAGLDPATVGLLECHATGTAVGDAAEITATGRVFAGHSGLPIGSVKSNVGHLLAPAGAAGLLKVIGALATGLRPPTLGADVPAPALAGQPLRLLTAAEDWPGPRRAAVSAFGFGGANAHLIVDAWDGTGAQPPPPPPPAGGHHRGEPGADRRRDAGGAVGRGRDDETATGHDPDHAPVNGHHPHEPSTSHHRAEPGADHRPNPEPALLPHRQDDQAAVAHHPGTPATPHPPDARPAGRHRRCGEAAAGHRPDRGSPAGPRPPGGPVAVVALAVRTGDDADTTAAFTRAVLTGRATRAPRTAVSTALDGLRFPPVDLADTLPQQILVLDAAREAARGLAFPRERTAVLIGMGDDPRIPRYALRRRITAAWEQAGLPDPPGTADRLREACHAPVSAAAAIGSLPNVVANRINAQLDLAGPGFTVSCEEASGLVALRLAARALRAREADAALVGAVDLSHDKVHTAALDGLGLSRAPGDAAVVLVLKRLAEAERDGDHVLALLDDDAGRAEPDLRFGANVADEGVCDVTGMFGSAHAACGLLAVATAVTALHHRVRPRPVAGAEPAPDVETAEVVVPVLAGPVHRVRLRAAAVADAEAPAPDAGPDGPRVGVPAHVPPLRFPEPGPPPGVMEPAPALPPVLDGATPVLVPAGAGGGDPAMTAALRHGARVRALHQDHLAARTHAHVHFLHGRRRLTAALAAAPPQALTVPARPFAPAPPGPVLGRAELERLVTGPVSAVLGAAFRPLDGRARRNRPPAPPFLLLDRILGIDGRPASLGTGTIRSETELPPGSWFLGADGRMPAALLTETCQANQVLLGWLGLDLLHSGDRVYRALGCEVTFHGSLPRAGETLRHDIRVERHVRHPQGALLTVFHADCHVGDELRFTVRNAQAGLFTDAELAAADGVRWQPPAAPPPDVPHDPPPPPPAVPRGFPAEAVRAFADGRPHDCFGPGWSRARDHRRTPRIDPGRLLMIDRVTGWDPAGGAWGRGLLRAEADIRPDAWYFAAHFPNDPCVPGSLMMHGALQAMAFQLAALGLTLDHDGARFEPVPGLTAVTRCRRQATPAHRTLVYEVHTAGVVAGPEPALYADVLVSVDGIPALHGQGLALRLVPDSGPPVRTGRREETVDPDTDTWVRDHCPTLTVPVLPMMSVVDRLAAAACDATGNGPEGLALRDVRIRQWLTVDRPLRLTTQVRTVPGGAELTLLRCRRADPVAQFEPAASARLDLTGTRQRPRPFPPLTDAAPTPLPYATGAVFHGPAFHYVTSLSTGSTGATAVLDAGHPGVPRGRLHQGLLDGALHIAPFSELWRWAPETAADGSLAYPWRLESFDFYEQLPHTGPVTAEARFRGFHPDGPSFPLIDFQLQAGGRVLAAFRLIAILLGGGPHGRIPLADRLAFARDRRYLRGAGVSRTEQGVTTLTLAEAERHDWLPGTVQTLYGLPTDVPLADHLAALAVKDHVARLARVHPCTVQTAPDLRSARTDNGTGRRYGIVVTREGDGVRVVTADGPG